MTPLAVLAALAATIGGGTYQGKVDAPCDSTCIARLVVVDDGRSLTTRSFVGAPCDLAETTDSDSKPAPRGTPVRRRRLVPLEDALPGRRGALRGRRALGERDDALPRPRARGLLGCDVHVHRAAQTPCEAERALRVGRHARARDRGVRSRLHEGDAGGRRVERQARLPRVAGLPRGRAQLHAAARRAAERARERGLPARAARARGDQGLRWRFHRCPVARRVSSTCGAINVGCSVARGVARAWWATLVAPTIRAASRAGAAGPAGPGSTRCRRRTRPSRSRGRPDPLDGPTG